MSIKETIAFIFCGFMIFALGTVIGFVNTDRYWKKDLIERGFAEWKVNPKTGQTYFSYKASTWGQILEGGYSKENVKAFWDKRTITNSYDKGFKEAVRDN